MKTWKTALADCISLFANAKKNSEADKTDAIFVHCSGMHCNPATLEAVFRNGVSSIPLKVTVFQQVGNCVTTCNAALGQKPV